MKTMLKKLLKALFCLVVPMRRYILLESIPDFADNTKAVFDEMIRRGLNRKYKLVWWLAKEDAVCPDAPNVIGIYGKKKLQYYRRRACCLISCNRFLVPFRRGQVAIYLSHGTAVKSTREYYTIPEEIDWFVVASEAMLPIQCYELNFDPAKTVALGFPRNDVFAEAKIDIKACLQTDCDKVIAWYPTFRQHLGGLKTGCENALPLLHDVDKARELNEAAREASVLLVIKPHFAQDVSYIRDLNLSHIRFIDDAFYVANGITSYAFIGACDALITDYSSVYYDYTLCGKPIAAVWEDIEAYKANPGLIADYEHFLRGAEKIYSVAELGAFVRRVAAGTDLRKAERESVMRETNLANDGQNAARVVDFILGAAKL